MFQSRVLTMATTLVLTAAAFTTLGVPSQSAKANLNDCPLPDRAIVTRAEAPRGTDLSGCVLTDRELDLGVIRMRFPNVGHSVTMYRTEAAGSTTASVSVGIDGLLDYSSQHAALTEEDQALNNDDPTIDPRTGTATNGCDYDDYVMSNFKVSSQGWTYYIGDGPQPASGTQGQTAQAAMSSGDSWYNEFSPCSATDTTAVPLFTYLGTDSRESDFDLNSEGDSVCGAEDRADTIDAGNLNPSSVIAMACVWRNHTSPTYTVRQADIRFNTTDKNFTYSPLAEDCSGQYDVRSTLMHEFGHVLGVDDNYEYAAKYQTMYGRGYVCRNFRRSLGKGDVEALKVRY